MNKHLLLHLKTVLWTGMMVCLLVGCSTPGTLPPTTPPEPVTLRINWQHGVQFLGFYAAQAQGYYAAEGLDVAIEPRPDAVDADKEPEWIAAGEFDFSVGSRNLLSAQAQGVPVTAIGAIFQLNPSAFFGRADSGIVTPADLAGRTVVVKGDAWRDLLRVLLEHDGLTLADVKEVPGGFDMTPFFEGEVEVWAGYLTNEAVLARQQGLELVTLPLYEYGIHNYSAAIYTGQESLAANPDRAARFLRASLRGWEWAVENPTEAVDVMLELYPDMAAERDFHLASFDASIPLIHPRGIRLGTIDCAVWYAHELLADLPTSPASGEGFCTTSILEAAWEGE